MKYLLALSGLIVSIAAAARPVPDAQTTPAPAREATQVVGEKADAPPPRHPLINVKFVLVRPPADKDRPEAADAQAAPVNSRLLDGGHDFVPNTYYYRAGYGWR